MKFYNRYGRLAAAAAGSYISRYAGKTRGGQRGITVPKLGTYYGGSRTALRNGTDNAPVTSQYDVRTWYKKKNMPRRKKKKWVKFKKQVNAVFNKQIAPTYFLYRTTATVTAIEGTQHWASVMLYTGGTGSAPNNDLGRIAEGVQGSSGNQLGTKFRFESACLDLLMRNAGTGTCLVDVYTIYCRKDVPSVYASPFILISTLEQLANQDTNTDTKISDTDIGYTPFHNPMFCSYYKVAKKRTLTLTGGGVSEIQMRDAKNRKMWGLDYYNKSSLKGWTKGYLLCIRGAFNGLVTPEVQLNIAYTRSYVLRQVQDSTWKSAAV